MGLQKWRQTGKNRGRTGPSGPAPDFRALGAVAAGAHLQPLRSGGPDCFWGAKRTAGRTGLGGRNLKDLGRTALGMGDTIRRLKRRGNVVRPRPQPTRRKKADAHPFEHHDGGERHGQTNENPNLDWLGAEQHQRAIPHLTPRGMTHCRLPLNTPHMFHILHKTRRFQMLSGARQKHFGISVYLPTKKAGRLVIGRDYNFTSAPTASAMDEKPSRARHSRSSRLMRVRRPVPS